MLTIEQAADLYAKAGHPRTIRSVQRDCAKGHLDSRKKETLLGSEVYLVTPQSVARVEVELERAKDERDVLREQIDRKDKIIDALIERSRETNFLVRGLQEMLTPLLGGPRREPRNDQNL